MTNIADRYWETTPTVHDLFMMFALTGLLVNSDGGEWDCDEYAREARRYADACMKERKKNVKPKPR